MNLWQRLTDWLFPTEYHYLQSDGSVFVTRYPATFIPYRETRSDLLYNSRMGMAGRERK